MQTTDIIADKSITSTDKSILTQRPQSAIRKLVSSRNVGQVKRAIETKYGFSPSDKYCRDLIKFIDEIDEGKPDSGIQIESLDDSAGLTGD